MYVRNTVIYMNDLTMASNLKKKLCHYENDCPN